MIYVYYGDNTSKRRQASDKLVSNLLKKENTTLLAMNDIDASAADFKQWLSAPSLFGEKYILKLEPVLENEEMSEYFFSNLAEIALSPHPVVVSERSLKKDTASKLKKFAADMEQFETPVSKTGKKEFNVFSLTDSFGARDKKETWLILQRAFQNGKTPEELCGILFWQTKNMLLVKKSTGASAATLGLNPFVFKKAESAAKKFSVEELQNISSKISALLYENREAGFDSDIALEQLVLNVL